MRAKTCPVCREKFTPVRSIQPTCVKFDCQLAYGIKVAEKREASGRAAYRKSLREAKAKAKPRSKWLAEAQAAFNKWIRLRDADRPCISCGRHHTGKYDAGHYRSVGSNPALRFSELNVHKQCVPCNQHKSGNAVEYRIGLMARIGIEGVEWLEGKHEPKHYTIDDLQAIKKMYIQKAKDLASHGHDE